MSKKQFVAYEHGKLQKIPDKGGFYNLYKNKFWACDEEGKILFYGHLTCPQCNSNKTIVDSTVASETHPGTSIVFIENIFVPLDIHDYIS